jgi:hypothetical protein
MKTMTKGFLLSLGLALLAQPALAMRCGNRLVGEGDHQLKVAGLCGEPALVETRTIYRSGIPRLDYRLNRPGLLSTTERELLLHRRSVVKVEVEVWTYNFGRNRLMREVLFEDGRVEEVRRLGYGF